MVVEAVTESLGQDWEMTEYEGVLSTPTRRGLYSPLLRLFIFTEIQHHAELPGSFTTGDDDFTAEEPSMGKKILLLIFADANVENASNASSTKHDSACHGLNQAFTVPR